MSETLLLVNPARRRKSRKTRSAAQRRATARLVALNRARRRGRKSNPVAALANPKRRRRAAPRSLSSVTRRRRRNPAPLGGGIGAMLMQGLKGGIGAIAVDAAVGFLPLPATMQTGYMRHAIRAAAAVALGTVGRRFAGPLAKDAAAGAMAVIMRDAVKEVAAGAGLNLGGIGYTAPALQYMPQRAALPNMAGMGRVGEYMDETSTMGEYVY